MGSVGGESVRIVHDYKRTKECLIRVRDMLEQTLMNVSALQDASDSSGVVKTSLGDLASSITRDCNTIVIAVISALYALRTLARDVSNTSKEKENGEPDYE